MHKFDEMFTQGFDHICGCLLTAMQHLVIEICHLSTG